MATKFTKEEEEQNRKEKLIENPKISFEEMTKEELIENAIEYILGDVSYPQENEHNWEYLRKYEYLIMGYHSCDKIVQIHSVEPEDLESAKNIIRALENDGHILNCIICYNELLNDYVCMERIKINKIKHKKL